MHDFRLHVITSALMLAASACVLAPMEGDEESQARGSVPATLEVSPGLDEASATSSKAEGEPGSAKSRVDGATERMQRLDFVAGPTPDPWHGTGVDGCFSGPTPDPWNPGQPSENDGRTGSTSPDQGSSASGTKPKN